MTGIPLLPAKRLQAFSPDELEMVVEHWLYATLHDHYEHIVEFGGPGDKGRDRAAFIGAVGTDPWDNYQCKQYAKTLAPRDLWPELGKLVFYVTSGDYTCPRRYAFVAPRGIGTSAVDLLADHERLRAGLARNWDRLCARLCPLDEIRDALRDFQFPEFVPIAGGQIIDDLRTTHVYPYFFGGGLAKPRPEVAPPPEEIADHELPYISQLVAAYDEHSAATVADAPTALGTAPYGEHLRASRKEFYCAESLREFSKDNFDNPQTFAELQQMMHDGVRHTIFRSYDSGYDRVLATCEKAVSVQLGDHPLAPDTNPADRAGICHQLANEGKVRWTA